MEKRVPIAIVVHLARAEDHTAAGPELTYTDNISVHGACVISSRLWQSGEMADVTSFNDRITLRGRVVYCVKHEEGRHYVGLYFNEQEVTWSPHVKSVGPKIGASLRDLVRPARDAHSANTCMCIGSAPLLTLHRKNIPISYKRRPYAAGRPETTTYYQTIPASALCRA